jgi:Transposase DDE domain
VEIEAPDHTTIGRRVSRLVLRIDEHIIHSNEPAVIAVDSSGIKVTNRGEWLSRKHGVERRGWLKLHVAVDTRSGQVLSMEVTEEDVHDTRMLKPLIEGSLKVAPVGKALGDGAYDSRANFQFLSSNGIEPVIRVRKNSVPKARGCYARKYAVQEQLQDRETWSKKHGYGHRWIVESAFSSIKGRLGEHIRAKKLSNMAQEVRLKVFTYNWLIKGLPMAKGIE